MPGSNDSKSTKPGHRNLQKSNIPTQNQDRSKENQEEIQSKPEEINLVTMWNFLQRLEKKLDDQSTNTSSLPKIQQDLSETKEQLEKVVNTAKEAKEKAEDAVKAVKENEEKMKGIEERANEAKEISVGANSLTKDAMTLASAANEKALGNEYEIEELRINMAKQTEELTAIKELLSEKQNVPESRNDAETCNNPRNVEPEKVKTNSVIRSVGNVLNILNIGKDKEESLTEEQRNRRSYKAALLTKQAEGERAFIPKKEVLLKNTTEEEVMKDVAIMI